MIVERAIVNFNRRVNSGEMYTEGQAGGAPMVSEFSKHSRDLVCPRRGGLTLGLNQAIQNAFSILPVGVTLDAGQVHRLAPPYSLSAIRIEMFRMRTLGDLACKIVDNKLAYYLATK